MEGKRVLLVEDDQVTAKLYSKLLTKWGYVVHFVHDGYSALQMLENEHYDLLFTDNQIPHITGIELIKRITAKHPATESVLITGDDVQAKSLNHCTVLKKPIMPDYLKFQLALILSRSDFQQYGYGK